MLFRNLNSRLRRSEGNFQSQLIGFLVHPLDLLLLIALLIELHVFVDVFIAVAQPAVDQACQVVGQGGDGLGWAQLCAQSLNLAPT